MYIPLKVFLSNLIYSITPKRELSQFQHLKDIRFDTIPGAAIQMLIGADAPEMFCVGNIRKSPKGTPYAIDTPLDWSLLGPSIAVPAQKILGGQ